MELSIEYDMQPGESNSSYASTPNPRHKYGPIPDPFYDSPPPNVAGLGKQSLHVTRKDIIRVQRAPENSNALVCFRHCRPYEALHAALNQNQVLRYLVTALGGFLGEGAIIIVEIVSLFTYW